MSNKSLDAAIALAKLSKCRHKHGAVLIKNGQVIAAGTNIRLQVPSDTNWRHCSLHAEEYVLTVAGNQASGSTLYIARVNNHGEPRLSLPCARCRRKIIRSKVRRVVNT